MYTQRGRQRPQYVYVSRRIHVVYMKGAHGGKDLEGYEETGGKRTGTSATSFILYK